MAEMKNALSFATLKLHDWITNRHILERMEELNKIQWLSRDGLLAVQRAKLQRIVEYANQYVPYYQHIFNEVGFHPDDLRKDIANINKIPFLTKAIIRSNWNDMLTTEPKRRRRMNKLNTSGSTGEPLVFMQDSYFQDYTTAETQHHMSWLGWDFGDLHAWIYIAPTKPTMREKYRAQFADWVWNRFQLNACSMNEESMTIFAKRLQDQKIKLLWCCTSSLYHFARFIRTSPFQNITFDGIFTTAEVLLPAVRLYIEETFNCKLFNRYGTMELGGLACECQAHTGYHVSVDNNYLEILNNGIPTQADQVGDIIVTNLNNRAMPFIRYSLGDAGAWSAGENCSCGRSAPKLNVIEGRITEMFQTRDGRYVRAGFSGGFSCLTHPAITQFQVIQKSLDRMVMRLVPNGEIPQPVLEEIRQTIQTTFGNNVEVDFEFIDKIQPLPSGKHQYAISELNRS